MAIHGQLDTVNLYLYLCLLKDLKAPNLLRPTDATPELSSAASVVAHMK